MTQNEEEREAREWFQQLKRDDERSAPSFASVVNAANSERVGRKVDSWRYFRLATVSVAAMLVLSASGWLWFIRQEQVLLPPPVPADANRSGTLSCNCGGDLPPPPRPQTSPRSVRHKRSVPRESINTLISQWHSPTEFLLQTSGQRWLKEVPRLGVPRLEIKSLDFEQKNEMEEL
ncbi:MAG: hypothetical protein JST85_12285 [Acidobacteria bacterium]|nr:hypothetical protein [Acidobacteriota bacterium]